MKVKTTKRSLFTAVVALVLCFSMLMGTTYAWFTDSVTSENNIIQTGTLDVEFEYSTDMTNWEKLTSTSNVFKADALWEPGYCEVVYLRVSNLGTLALKYQLGINVVSETTGINEQGDSFYLSNYINFGLISDVSAAYADREAARGAVTTALKLNDGTVADGSMVAGAAPKTYAMVVYMPETVGNEANHDGSKQPEIHLGLSVIATQLASEEDAFGKDYDAPAVYPIIDMSVKDGEAITLVAGEVAVTVPASAADASYTLNVPNKSLQESASGETTVTFEIDLLSDGQKVVADGTLYDVTIEVEPMMNVTAVTHNGANVANFDYDPITGLITFQTDSFSPFAVTYEERNDVSGVVVEDGKIVSGVFEGVDPVAWDPTLAEADSEYIAVNYTVNGETCYAVSPRATTVVLAAPDTVYTSAYDNYTVKTVAAGKLYAEFSALQNNEFSTVYLLPGTYNEGTTLNIYSSMDIIGLGDKDSVKIIKTSSSNSNRHLFNCNGTKADYIEVTLKNLYLDATAKTTGGKDNAAVQSIRKTKVKCYDLTVVKGTGWDAVAFYVNGNNAVDGVKYPAYMYVENCTLNRTFGVVTTSGSYKFYHSGLTYNGNAYTNNSGSIKNVAMEPSDWEW